MVASIGCSFSGTVLLLQNHHPRFRGAPSGHFRMLTKRPPSVDSGLGNAIRGFSAEMRLRRVTREGSEAYR